MDADDCLRDRGKVPGPRPCNTWYPAYTRHEHTTQKHPRNPQKADTGALTTWSVCKDPNTYTHAHTQYSHAHTHTSGMEHGRKGAIHA